MNFHKVAEKIVIHEPKIREIAGFRLLPFEGVPEEIIKQLISHFVT